MKSNLLMKLTVLALIFAFGIVSGLAQDKTGTNMGDKGGKVTPQAESAAKLELAYSAAKYGRANRDADAMIFAAKILKENPANPLKTTKTTEGGTADSGAKAAVADQTADAYLADAKKFAGNNKTVLARIADVSKMASRGATNGAQRTIETVKAGGSDLYKVSFNGGEQGIVLLSGDGSTDLDLYIYDENGNLVASDTDGLDDCAVRFFPKWTGTFIIRVKNLGSVYNRYAMVTN